MSRMDRALQTRRPVEDLTSWHSLRRWSTRSASRMRFQKCGYVYATTQTPIW